MLASPLALARKGHTRSVFSPPDTLVRSVPPQKKTAGSLTAAATPWTPTAAVRPSAVPTGTAPKPPAPLHTSPPLQPQTTPSGAVPPTALGNSPSLQPSLLRAGVLPPLDCTGGPSSPLAVTTPLSTSKHIITDEAAESGVYTYEMFQCLRKDCAHTPRRVLNWVVELYRNFPIFKVPPHLVLTVEQPIIEDDGSSKDGGVLLGRTGRRRVVRQIQHKVLSVLSRITPQKYGDLQRELMELPLKQTTNDELKEVVKVFFEKAVQEQTFSPLYANLVADICMTSEGDRDLTREQREKLLSFRMRRELLTTCQEEFSRPLQLSEDDKVDRNTGKPLAPEEIEMKRDRMNRRLCGNINFVGELYKKKLVTERVLGYILEVLVGDFDKDHPSKKEDYVFGVFATLMTCVGCMIKDTNPGMLDRYMALARVIEQHHTSNRVRFKMMNLADLQRRSFVTKGLMTTEERERDQVESQRRMTEEIARLAKERQQELNDTVVSQAMMSHSARPHTPTTLAPQRNNGPNFHGNRPSALNQSALASRNATSTSQQQPPSTPPHANHHVNPNTIELKHPHGTPTASPAKPPTKPAPFNVNNFSSSPMMTPPPKYQRNVASNVERSPIVHPSAGLGVPNVLSAERLSESVQSSGMSRAMSTSSLGSYHGAPATPMSPGAPPVPLHDLATALMTQYCTNKNLDEVLHTMRSLTVKHRVHLLTHWLRRAVTTTRFFTEREQIWQLFEGILASSASERDAILSPHDLAVAFLEWQRYDIECGQFSNCPRLFANIGGMIAPLYSKPAGSPTSGASKEPQEQQLERLRGILNGMVFTICLRELHAHDNLIAIPTLVKDAQPVVQQILSQLPTESQGVRGDLLLALQNRFRILPFVLYGDGSLTRAKTPNASRNSPMGDSLGVYDAFSQCLAFPKVADDIEFTLYRRMREAPDASGWRDHAISLGATVPRDTPSNPATRLSHVMKVVGTLLTVLHPKDGSKPLTLNIRSEDLDHVVHSMLHKRKNGVDYQCAVVAELMMHFSYTVANIQRPAVAEYSSKTSLSPSQQQMMNSSLSDANTSWSTIDTRMSKMATIFRRWASSNIIQAAPVLDVLRSIVESTSGHHSTPEEIVRSSTMAPAEDLYTLQYNFVVENSWSSALQMLSS